MTNEGILTSPKPKLHQGSHARQGAFPGLALSTHLPNVDPTPWFSCMLGARYFPPLAKLPPHCKKSGPGEKSPASKRSKAVSLGNGLPISSKRRSGRWWEKRQPKDIYCLIWSSSRSLAPFPWPCSILPLRYL